MDVLERMMFRLRGELYDLSDRRFPGLRARHYRLLSRLPADGERSSRLAAASGLSKQALAQTLVPLQDGGYVEVVPDPGTTGGPGCSGSPTAAGRSLPPSASSWRPSRRSGPRRWGTERYATARAVFSEVSAQVTDGMTTLVALDGS